MISAQPDFCVLSVLINPALQVYFESLSFTYSLPPSPEPGAIVIVGDGKFCSIPHVPSGLSYCLYHVKNSNFDAFSL
ncbi:hypothetical protein QVH35_04390 [Candidatus Nitrosotenuis chungbukensis]|uniref:hypothetical protein n=1 Tax=Candidatus Nitrosotenuis chungbukensis TaxID=1353246 RepID=UPI002672261F|nr:hypothetical protein [Candidatus Nitrosotenuis chungbukensis]WKT58622.1 hypothetical protein QVH35_04390 [Candidatus Nitrosotenuis chungbukensis]